MREIKFRCFYDGKMYPVLELWGEDGMSVNGIKMELDGLELRTVSPDSDHLKGLMQFTGLKDKNGKEIYEGDILRLNDGDISHHRIYWDEKECRFFDERLEDGDSQTGYDCFEFVKDCKIIGNIYENPELVSSSEIPTEK